MFTCPFPDCNKRYSTVPGIRKHWSSSTGHIGECPRLIGTNLFTSQTSQSNGQHSDDPNDNALIDMMGLTDGNVDTRSSGRFARASGLGAHPCGEVYSQPCVVYKSVTTLAVDVPCAMDLGPWETAVGAFFAICKEGIEECSIHCKLLLAESGKSFVSVKNAIENYR